MSNMLSAHGLLPLAFCLSLGACASEVTKSAPDKVDVRASAPGAATCLPTTPAQNATGAQATNAVRTRAGLATLRADSRIAEAAARHACDMAERGRMTHQGSQTTGPAQRVKALGFAPRMTAENIAAGPFDLDRVLSEWNRSEGHLSNILIPQMSSFGIGQAIGSDGKTRYWAAVYAAPRGR